MSKILFPISVVHLFYQNIDQLAVLVLLYSVINNNY